MAESLGARLRQRREERQVPLAAIADETKIKLSLLEALERDDVSRWPTGIFRRAYIRAYADAIGLDPNVVVREFLERHPDPAEVVETLTAIASAGQAGSGPPTRLRHFVDSAIGSLTRLRNSPTLEVSADPDDAPVAVTLGSGRDLAVAPPSDLARAGGTNENRPDDAPRSTSAWAGPDLPAVARVCTALGQVQEADQVTPLLADAARLIHATGLVVWIWDARTEALRAVLAHGYSDSVLAALPAVGPDEDNATAAAFRSARPSVIKGRDGTGGALVVPLLTSAGCTGALAVELTNGGEQTRAVQALATIFAALLAQLTGGAQPAEARERDPTARHA